jgi:transposase-like protein
MKETKIICHHCNSDSFKKNGSTKGVQRFLCKTCNRSFSSNGERYDKSIKEQAVKMYLNNVGIRKTALLLGVSAPSVLQWIRKAGRDLAFKLSAVSNAIKDDIPDVIEMDEIFTYIKKNSTLKNSKGLSSGLLILGTKVVSFPITSAKE